MYFAVIVLRCQVAVLKLLFIASPFATISYPLHLSLAYVLIAIKKDEVCICADENREVEWFSVERFTDEYFNINDILLYHKLISFAHRYLNVNGRSAQS